MIKSKYNLLFITSLMISAVSCSTQNKTHKKPTPHTPNTHTTATEHKKPEITHIRNYDFFPQNIADSSKNNNTASYGSIVSAKPAGYKVTKDYFPSMGQNFRQRFLILHYTALDNEKSAMVLTQQSVSSHYLVNDTNDNEIYQLVDENKRAFHAGISHWRGFEQLNDNSIGIEIVNKGYTTVEGKKVFVDYPEWQFRKVAALAKDIITRYQMPPTNVLGHSDIAPTRKQDPGPTFPWKRLYNEYQIGMWYDDATKQYFISQMTPEEFEVQLSSAPFIFNYQTMLKNFGYKIELSGANDTTTQKVVEAFQYHFRPEKCDGIMEIETYAILRALLQKYPK